MSDKNGTVNAVVVITDCRDPNAMGRVSARLTSLLGCQVIPVGVESDLEAAGSLVDMFDALRLDGPNLVVTNVAPRNGSAKHWGNGTPFAFFQHQDVTVVGTIDGQTLALVKKLGLVDTVNQVDIADVARVADWSAEEAKLVTETQFRSFEFVPRLAELLVAGKVDVPFVNTPIPELVLDGLFGRIWFIDCFGNIKTTALPGDVDFQAGSSIQTVLCDDPLPCYEHLAQVPDNETAVIIGSSGFGQDRFLEVVVNGGRADDRYQSFVGQKVFEVK